MKSKIRVLMVNHAYIRWINRLAVDRLSSYDDLEIIVLAPQFINIGSAKTLSLERDLYPTKYRLLSSTMYKYAFRGPAFKGLSSLIRELKPDIVYMAYEPGSLSVLQATAAIRGMRSKLACFTVDNLYKRLSGEAVLRIKNREWFGSIGMLLAAFVESITLPRVDYLIGCNQEALTNYSQYRHYRKPTQLVPIGIDVERFKKLDSSTLRAQLGLTDFVIGYFGRLCREKGVHLLLEAVSEFDPPYQLLIDQFMDAMQDQEYLVFIKELAGRLGILDKIIFFDAPHHEMPLYLNCADCAVIPAITTPKVKEQYGRVIVEAMACEVPVIGSNSGNIPSLIGDTGLIFDECDVQTLRRHLLTLRSDVDYRQQLGASARTRAIHNYSIDVEADLYHRIFLTMH